MGLGGGRREVAGVATVERAEIVKQSSFTAQYQHNKFPNFFYSEGQKVL
jgi:hypothetical protein